MRLAQMFVVELAFRYREVVHPMVRTVHQQADETEATDMLMPTRASLAQRALDARWIDSITSLGILWFVIKEGRRAWAVGVTFHDFDPTHFTAQAVRAVILEGTR
jgi:hypothetical protein